MAPHDPGSGEALRPGHRDEVLLEGADEVGPQEAEVDGDGAGGDGHRGQDHFVQVGERGLGERRVPGGREPAEADGEHRHQDGRHHERWQGEQSEGRCRRDVVEPPVGFARHHQGERDGDGEGDQLADEDELDGHRCAGGQDVGHRLVVEVRGPEVPVEGRVQPDRVLVPQRQVEPELLQQDRPVGGGVVGAEDLGRRVAGQQVDEHEHQDGDDEGHHQQLDEPPDQVLAHVRALCPVDLVATWTARWPSG